MDGRKRTNDIFKQLSFGASFKKKKPKLKRGDTKIDTKELIEATCESELIKRATNSSKSTLTFDLNQTKPEESPLLIMSNLLSSKDIDTGCKKLKKKKKKKSKEVLQLEKEQELINHMRNVNELHVRGEHVPAPCAEFQELQDVLQIDQNLIDKITQQGILKPTPIQMQTIPIMMQQRNILASAPTGSGKTLAFLIPLIARGLKLYKKKDKSVIKYVVLAPTRELAKQIFEEALKLTINQVVSVALVPSDAQQFQSANIIISTPNRLIYAIDSDTPPVLDHVEYMVVDESDRLFESGPTGFRDQLARIYRSCNGSHVRRAFFSATFSFEVEQWCLENLPDLIAVSVGVRNRAISTVSQRLVYTGTESGKLMTLRQMMETGALPPPVLIFVQSIDRVKQLKEELMEPNWKVDAIYGQMKQNERDAAVSKFHSGHTWVLICTELMGRGIDFKGVKMVVNFDFPASAISYIHRIGRTGRAGKPGMAVTFFTDADKPMLRNIANVIKEAGCPIPEYILKFSKAKRGTKKLLKQRAPRRKALRTKEKTKRKTHAKQKDTGGKKEI